MCTKPVNEGLDRFTVPLGRHTACEAAGTLKLCVFYSMSHSPCLSPPILCYMCFCLLVEGAT